MDILFILLLFFILLNILYWTLKVGISPMFSSLKATSFIKQYIKKHDSKTIIDLGSGWGTLALSIAISNPNKQIIAYELSFFPYYFSKLLVIIFKVKNLNFYRKDFYEIEFYEKTLYITYLYPKGMEKLEQKILNGDYKIDIISNTFSFKNINYSSKLVLNDFFKTPIYFYKI